MTRSHFLQPFLRSSGAALCLRNARSGVPIATTVETAFDSSARRRGLLGRDSLPASHALIIAPSSLVHTFGMRFSIDVMFVARDGVVLKLRRRLPPRRIAGRIGSFAVVELAPGQIDASETRVGDIMEAVPL
jgi:uncharacterized protein